MRRLWPGWLLCIATAGLFGYMALVEAPAISARLGGLKLPDVVPLGLGIDAARELFAAFKADLEAAEAAGRESASAAYLALHAGSDLVFPPMLAISLGFCAFAALAGRAAGKAPPRAASVAVGLVMALAFTYLGYDFVENAVADAVFGPAALARPFNEEMAFVLKVLTRGKYLSLAVAFVLIAAVWIWRWRSRSPA